MISKSLCDSVGGGGVVPQIFRDLKSLYDSVGGGGVVAEICRGLQKPMRGEGDSSAEFFFSVTSKRNFQLMGPFRFFYFPEGGGARAPWAPPLNRPLMLV